MKNFNKCSSWWINRFCRWNGWQRRGSLILPVLLILGLKHKNAAAISVFCVNAGVLVSFIVHAVMGHLTIDVPWFAAFSLIAVTGAFIGSRMMTRRFSHKTVKYLFAFVLTGIAIKLYLEALL
ncbi:sulfite exporter TauE/SafE family protein [Candidatus Bathyarchaeota archaeon]|nr:sulfite exporter TauE/SafE family protein [Candidatus Bathyarchaeota archaeon]